MANALVIGGSDGIGLALTRALLADGWRVTGLSRSPSPLADDRLAHRVVDVRAPDYRELLADAAEELGEVDLCVYCAGVGASIDLSDLAVDRETFEVNLLGAVATAEVLIPRMVERGAGHLIGISSLADRFINADAPAYSGSKAGMSSYFEGLALACRPRGVAVTSVRFGFVDTKMAKSEVRPFMVTPERAARVIMRCVRSRPIRRTYPLRMAALLWLVGIGPRLRVWWS